MPIILKFNFTDGSHKVIRIPAEIWRKNNYNVSKVFVFKNEVQSIELDPYLETADTDVSNNNWPTKVVPSRFDAFKSSNRRNY